MSYEGFLVVASYGHCRQWVPYDIVTPAELGNFSAVVSTFRIMPEIEDNVLDVLHFLIRVHTAQAPLIEAATRARSTFLLKADTFYTR
jgi:hypothetical protein